MANIVAVLEKDGAFPTLVSALKAAKLDGTLSGTGPFTVFAPSEDAFKALKDGQLTAWQKDSAKLIKVLNFHVVPGKYSAADLLEYHFIKTTEGQRLLLTSQLNNMGYADTAASDAYGYISGGTHTVGIIRTLKVNGATITRPDIAADNGFVHAIDHVLVPWFLDLIAK